MNKKYILIPVVFAILTLTAACGGPVTDEAGEMPVSGAAALSTDMHNAANSLDYYGVYEGLLPAADGPGIQMTLTLNKDKTFILNSEYLEAEDGVFTDNGTFAIDGNVVTLLVGEQPYAFKVEEGRVKMLDMDRHEITGPLADAYTLTQTKTF